MQCSFLALVRRHAWLVVMLEVVVLNQLPICNFWISIVSRKEGTVFFFLVSLPTLESDYIWIHVGKFHNGGKALHNKGDSVSKGIQTRDFFVKDEGLLTTPP